MTTAASDLNNTAKTWGISQETMQHFAAQYDGLNGLVYPSLSGYRNRMLLINAKPGQAKNLWDNHTRHLPMPPLFNIPCLELPESREHGVYLSNGERSMMVMRPFNENLRLTTVRGKLTGTDKKNARHALTWRRRGKPLQRKGNKKPMTIVAATQITYNQKSSPDSAIYRDASVAAWSITVNMQWGDRR